MNNECIEHHNTNNIIIKNDIFKERIIYILYVFCEILSYAPSF